MKLSRHDLVHATDVQLKSIGLNRKLNKGWLRRALQSDFTEPEIELFHKAAEKSLKIETVSAVDSNVESVRAKMQMRMQTGFRKYGVTTERTDLTRKQWLIHAQEEAMDLAVYLEKLIQLEP